MPPPRLAHRLLSAAAALLAAVVYSAGTGEAHKAITSKFVFNEDVFPVMRAHCSQCHVDGGVAPMSLMTYDDAAPWAESLRIELLGEDTPPWHPWRLSARELDLLLVWATGGAPRGDAAKAPPPVTLVNAWGSGAPDVALKMREPFVLPGPSTEGAHEVVLAVGSAATRPVAAVDVLPGNPAIVRSVTLLLKSAAGATTPLATWMPGAGAAVGLKAPVRVAEGASIVARFTYKRTWKYEGQDLADQSTVGLYYTAPGAKTAAPATVPAPRPPRQF